MINTTGSAPSLWVIQNRLRAIRRREPAQYGKPTGNEGVQFRFLPDGVADPLLEALRREHPERFPLKPLECHGGEW